MIIASRPLYILGLLGVAVGLFFGLRGLLVAHEAVSEVTRKGGDSASLFRADRLGSALDKVRAKVGSDGELLRLSVYPGYLEVDASTGSEDHGRAFKVQGDGHVVEHPLALTGPGRLKDNTFPLADIDAKAAERLAGAVAAKEHAKLDDVSYLIASIDPVTGKPGWNVYVKNSKYWRAALDGSALSNPDQDARKALDNASKALDDATGGTSGSTRDVSDCVAAAGGDVAKIQACSG